MTYDKNFADSNIGSLTEDIRDCLDGDVDYVFDGSLYTDVEAIEYSLLESSRITEFTTGVYNNGGPFDLYLMTNKKEHIPVGENLDASISHKFDLTVISLDEGEYVKGYKVVFKTPASLSSFTSGSLTNIESRLPHTYGLYVSTDKRPLFLWKEGLFSDLNYDLSFLKLDLGKDESIKDIKLLFHEEVLPGFKNIEAPLLEGRVKHLESVATKYFGGKLENLVFPNMVFVSGEYGGKIISNGDEWDTYTYVGQLKKENLPSTGTGGIKILSLILVWIGLSTIAIIFKKALTKFKL